MARTEAPRESGADRVVRVASAAGGTALAAATRSLAALRPAAKPLHPVGVVVTGTLERHGSAVPSGAPWVDEAGRDDVLVRISRAIGLPRAVPDIHGLALRVLTAGAGGDLLFASTGWGRLGRFVLTFGGRPETRPMTTLLPYRTSDGPVLLGARSVGGPEKGPEDGPETEQTYELSWSRPLGEWHPFAALHLSGDESHEQQVSFDPVRHQLPGLTQYPWVRRLREPAYLSARRSRRP